MLGIDYPPKLRKLIDSIKISPDDKKHWVKNPQERYFSYYNYYNNQVNWHYLITPPTMNPYNWIVKSRINTPKYYNRNIYAVNSLFAIGGGAIDQLTRSLTYRRVGGSTQDKIFYVSKYEDKSDQKLIYRVEFKIISEIIQIKDKLQFPPFKDSISNSGFNYSASPGIPMKNIGFKNKQDLLLQDLFTAELLYVSWCTNPNSTIKPKEVWSVAARPKLKKLEEVVEKLHLNEPCCRAISYCSTLEQFIGLPLWLPISLYLEKRFKETMIGIAVGINRLGEDWSRLSSTFKNSKCIYVGDFSKYDQTIPSSLILRSFDYMFSLFEETPFSTNYIKNFREWMLDNIMNKFYIIDNKITFDVKSGIPSGSLWTSLLGSICNIIMLVETLKDMNIVNYSPVVYGDDHIIIFYEDIDMKSFKDIFNSKILNNYGVKGNPDEARICNPKEYYVTYKRPVYKPGSYLEKGTSKLKPKYTEYSNNPFETWDYNKGTTHRWSYNFKNRVKFLQYSFLKDGRCIRPWSESLVRIINPEDKISTPYEHEVLLTSHLIDNFNNAHCRNWIYHMLYDNLYHKIGFNHKLNRLERQYDLRLSPIIRENLEKEDPNLRGRAWYRHIDYKVDTMKELSMSKFNTRWSRLIKTCELVHDEIITVPFYSIKNIMLELIRKGMTSEQEVLNSFKKYEIRQGDISLYYTTLYNGDLTKTRERLISIEKIIKSKTNINYSTENLVFRMLPRRKQLNFSIYISLLKNPMELIDYELDSNFRYPRKIDYMNIVTTDFKPIFLNQLFLKLIQYEFKLVYAEWIKPGIDKLTLLSNYYISN